MNFILLKKARVVFSLLFFILTLVIFLNVNEWFTVNFSNAVTYLQFSPSLVKFLSVLSLGGIGFLIVIVVTLLFGRVYCSSICPLGTLQDIFLFLSRKILKQKRYFMLKPYSVMRYSILSITIVFLLFGSIFLLNLLDPFSIFGKIIVNIVRPALLSLNNYAASILNSFGIYFLDPHEIRSYSLLSIIIASCFLLSVTVMSIFRGRLFCNTVCPVGTLLGIISKFSVYQITIEELNCKSCNLCERECKAGCIDKQNKVIDFSRCVSCFNCFNACHSEGIVYRNTLRRSESLAKYEADNSKRYFISSLIGYFASFSFLSIAQVKIVPKKETTISVERKFPVSPPGSNSIEKFTSSCIACHLCIAACPAQVLQPAFLEYGFLGMMQPRMDYITSFCNYECVICSDVCPTGAIKKISLGEKKTIQLGKAVFIKDNCIVYTEETACGACSEHCPTKAVDMLEMHKNIKAPKLNNEICVGCGACEYACPTKPYKAIYVEGNPIHLEAKKPDVKKLEEIRVKDDFPF